MADTNAQTSSKKPDDSDSMGVVFRDEHADEIDDTKEQEEKDVITRAFYEAAGANDPDVPSGTIVTDKKEVGPSVFGAITGAASQWAGDRVEKVKNMEVFQTPETPKVAPGILRKEIIEKAVETAPQVPHDDHQAVIERIKTLQHDAERVTGQPFIVKPKEEKKRPGWTHLIGRDSDKSKTDTGIATPASEQSRTSAIHRAEITPTTETNAVAPHIEGKFAANIDDYGTKKKPKIEEPLTREDVIAKNKAARIAAETLVRTELPQPESPNTGSVSQNIPVVEVPLVEEKPKSPFVPHGVPATHSKIRSWRGTVLIAGAVLLFLGVSVPISFYFFAGRTTSPAPVIFQGALHGSVERTVPLPATQTELLQTSLETTVASPDTLTEIYFTLPSEDENAAERIATTAEFFEILNPHVEGSFVRALENTFIIGGVPTQGPQPYIIITSFAFDTVFAGMINWEPFMSADLAPFFGTRVSRSFDKDARTEDRTTEPTFIDTALGTHNVRVLHDEQNNERITYGFVDQYTILITTSTDAFEKLLENFQ